jgi:hypothetical protein
MRLLPILAVALLLAGCASHPAPAAAPPPTDNGPDRVARGGGHGDDPVSDGPEVPHKVVTLVSQPITLPSQGPITYDADIPADTNNITFEIRDMAAYSISDLRVEVSDCGVFDQGANGLRGGSGGGGFGPELLCQEPKLGKVTVTVSATASIVVQGTFVLYGEQPLPPGTQT